MDTDADMSLSPPSVLADETSLAASYLRAPTRYENGQPVWDPPLSDDELAILQRIRRLLRSAVRVTPAEWSAIEPSVTVLRTFRTRSGAPTNAQVVAAIDSLIDILRIMLRD